MKNSNRKKAILCNAVLALLELAGIIESYALYGLAQYQYYTENVNLFSFLVSVLFCVCGLREEKGGAKMPEFVPVLRNIAAINLLLVFCTCLIGALTGYDGYSFSYIMFSDCSLFFHTLCPLLSTVIAFAVERSGRSSCRANLFALVPPALYLAVILPLNYLRIVHGPYTYLYVYEVPTGKLIGLVLLVGAVVLAFIFLYTWVKNRLFARERESSSP